MGHEHSNCGSSTLRLGKTPRLAFAGGGGRHDGPRAFTESGNLRSNYEDALRSLGTTATLLAFGSLSGKKSTTTCF